MVTEKRILLIMFLLLGLAGNAQRYKVNYEESDVKPYSLPSLLTSQGGMVINNVEDWEVFRKPEIFHALETHIYGRVPGTLDSMEVVVKESNGNAFNGIAKRKQLTLILTKNQKKLQVEVLIYLPKTDKKVPVFLGYNFYGNQGITDDKNVFITNSWVPIRPEIGINSHKADEDSRGINKRRWPIEKIVKAGYGVVTLYCGDIDPDWNNFEDGIHALFYNKGQNKPRPDEWATIAAWSWGLSRVMDYLETDSQIEHKKVIVLGHSRLGKTALWAAASDIRFAACISNNSGCMGASLSRRNYGESVEVINTAFPHWFCGNFKKYSKKEYMLPVDQHMVMALIAPRPLYIASASEDKWADPKGEFLSAKHASVVYNLYGIPGLICSEMPEIDFPLIDVVSYHVRTGIHDVTDFDWDQYIHFANKNNMNR